MAHILRSRLSARLTALFLVAGLLPVVGVGWVALTRLEDSLVDAARRRQEFLARSAGRLTLDAVERADQKLVTLARLLAQEFLDSDLGALQAANTDFRDAVVTRVSGLVEPSGVFLELQYFGGVESAFVGQVQNVAVASNFELNAEFNSRQIADNRASPAVNDPVNLGRPHRDTYLSQHGGQVGLRLSQPVWEPTGRSGALVGYVDFAELRGTLARLCDD